MKKAFKIISIILLALLIMAGVFIGITQIKMRLNIKNFAVEAASFSANQEKDKIHFLNAGSSDCIIIESNNLFAMVDSGEDSFYPENKPNLNLTGYEDKVLEYLKRIAGDENGKVVLEFIVGTHSHSDHIGAFDEIVLDEDITVKKAFLKEYRSEYIRDYEINRWDNQEVYDDMVNALNLKNVPIVSDISTEPFTLGNFEIEFFNTEYFTPENEKKIGENSNSLGILVSKGSTKAFLAGDIDNLNNTEAEIAPLIGEVTLLKSGHHGYIGSSTRAFIKTLNPEIVVVTNSLKRVYPNVLWNFTVTANACVFATVENDGVLSVFPDEGGILIYNNIH